MSGSNPESSDNTNSNNINNLNQNLKTEESDKTSLGVLTVKSPNRSKVSEPPTTTTADATIGEETTKPPLFGGKVVDTEPPQKKTEKAPLASPMAVSMGAESSFTTESGTTKKTASESISSSKSTEAALLQALQEAQENLKAKGIYLILVSAKSCGVNHHNNLSKSRIKLILY